MNRITAAAVLLLIPALCLWADYPFPDSTGDTEGKAPSGDDPFGPAGKTDTDSATIPFMPTEAEQPQPDSTVESDQNAESIQQPDGQTPVIEPSAVSDNPNVTFYRGWKYDYKRDIIGTGRINSKSVPSSKHYQFLTLGGRILEIKQYGLSQTLQKVHKYEYGPGGLKIGVKTSDANGKIRQKGVMEYDQAGRRTTETYYKPDGSLIIEYRYQYDDRGRLVRIAGHDQGGKVKKATEIAYDESGNPIEIKQFKGSSIRRTEKIKYDRQNREIARTIYDEYGKQAESTSYEYDSQGNRITKISEETLLTEQERGFAQQQRKKGLVYLDGKWLTPVERDRLISERQKRAEKAMVVHETPQMGEQSPLPPFDTTGQTTDSEKTTVPMPPMPPPMPKPGTGDTELAPGMPE